MIDCQNRFSCAALAAGEAAGALVRDRSCAAGTNGDADDAAAATVLLHSENFVRWIEGDFTPGAKVDDRSSG